MRFSGHIAAALYVLLTTSCAMAQAERAELGALLSSDCHDDNMRDRCDPESQRQVRALYNARPIEEMAVGGVQVRRAFYVDGYGQDMPLVSFERAPGADPRVVVYVPKLEEDGSRRVLELAAPVPLVVWNEVIAGTQHFDRALTPLRPQLPDDAIVMCLHSWVVTMEASDPRRERPVRRRTEDSCNDGLTVDAAFDLARQAYALLPACNALRLDQYRNEVSLFWACAVLEGDRLAAAEALNQATALNNAREQSPGLIHDMAQLNWAGEPSVRGHAVRAAWARLMDNEYVHFERIVGEDANQARLLGYIDDWDHSARPRYRFARVEQVWVRENGFDFRMKEATVSAWGDWQTP